MSMKNSSGTIESRTRDPTACSAVAQQLLRRLLRGVDYRLMKYILKLKT